MQRYERKWTIRARKITIHACLYKIIFLYAILTKCQLWKYINYWSEIRIYIKNRKSQLPPHILTKTI